MFFTAGPAPHRPSLFLPFVRDPMAHSVSRCPHKHLLDFIMICSLLEGVDVLNFLSNNLLQRSMFIVTEFSLAESIYCIALMLGFIWRIPDRKVANTNFVLHIIITSIPILFRRPKLKTAGRPASFHGTASSGDGDSSLPRPQTLHPPRQPSITDEDVEPVAIDGNTYRHMVQDLTTFKTNLLRLKRIIQEVSAGSQNRNVGGTCTMQSVKKINKISIINQ